VGKAPDVDSIGVTEIGYGSKADVTFLILDVCFTPVSSTDRCNTF